jgi:hypothetical protein
MYADWHFAADGEGCGSLVELIELLVSKPAPAYRTLAVTDPRDAGADRIFGEHKYRVDFPQKLRIGNGTSLDAPTDIRLLDDVFSMSLSSDELLCLMQAVRDVASDQADFSILFGSDVRMSFWWWPKAK